jgi:protein-S-isoprenylcysteine O-methyltransferase Ste14
MEIAAYWVALLTTVFVTPFLLLWFMVHPFSGKWRKVGPVKTYSIVFTVLALVMVVFFLFREPLLRIHYGVSLPLAVLAIFFLLVSISIGILRARYLTTAVMFGLPQISKREYPGKLLRQGIYAHIRHPRYLEAGFGLASIALFCNYLATYVLLAAYIPIIYLVVLLEESELKERFGEEYEKYCRDVPRVLPRFIRRKKLVGKE